MNQRLSSWKARKLSIASHVTLAKSVLMALPANSMQTTFLPKTTCDEVDRAIRNLVWGAKEDHGLIPWILYVSL